MRAFYLAAPEQVVSSALLEELGIVLSKEKAEGFPTIERLELTADHLGAALKETVAVSFSYLYLLVSGKPMDSGMRMREVTLVASPGAEKPMIDNSCGGSLRRPLCVVACRS
jgi:hypothetical protein